MKSNLKYDRHHAEQECEAKAAWDTATPEERAEFEKRFPQMFLECRHNAKLVERCKVLCTYAFCYPDTHHLLHVSDHIWEQISSLIAGGVIKPKVRPASPPLPQEPKDIVPYLIGHDDTPFTPEDEAGLQQLSDATLRMLRDDYVPAPNPGSPAATG